MASFDTVNYSLRPSKSIQRSLVFDDVRRLQDSLPLSNLLYVGFGSIWFVDFVLAHRVLRAPKLISVEANPVGYERAQFNKPFACVSVERGLSTSVLPPLYQRADLQNRPWMMWLDYDFAFDETVVSDVRLALESLPPNSIFLITFNAVASKYGTRTEREERLRAIFGDLVPAGLSKRALEEERLVALLRSLSMDFMKSVVADVARPGGFIPAFNIGYRDQAAMVTVGGILPSPADSASASAAVESPQWASLPQGTIVAPHLTAKESSALQAQLPSGPLSRAAVKLLGFDLEPEQIEAFQQYYLFYPNFAQVAT